MIHGISIIMLAYQEADNLSKLLPVVKENIELTGELYEIIVVDTMEPLDNTYDVCHENAVNYVNQKYSGFGGAFQTGIESASMDRIITLDSDGAHNPKYIPQMVALFEKGQCDVAIGSRYVTGGGTHDPWINVLMSRMLNISYGIFFGIKAKDLSTNFRMYNTTDLIDIKLSCSNYDVLQEILIKLRWKKGGTITIDEFPIVLESRMSGYSKRQLIKFVCSYIHTLFSLRKVEMRERRVDSLFCKK